jgi:HemX protein
MSAVWSMLYLMQHHEIKANRFGTLYQRLPSLGLLERMSAIATIIGLAFLTIAIVIAVTWLPDVLPDFSYTDPKVLATIVVWILYAAAITARFIARVNQRRFILLSLVGFGGVFLSLTIVNVVLSRFHDFG